VEVECAITRVYAKFIRRGHLITVRQTEAAPDAAFRVQVSSNSRSRGGRMGGRHRRSGSQWTSGSFETRELRWRSARRLTNRFRGAVRVTVPSSARATRLSDEVEWLGLCGMPLRRSPVTSSIQPRSSIEWNALLDAIVQCGAWRCRPILMGALSFEVPPARPGDFGERAPGEQTDFDGTNHLRRSRSQCAKRPRGPDAARPMLDTGGCAYPRPIPAARAIPRTCGGIRQAFQKSARR